MAPFIGGDFSDTPTRGFRAAPRHLAKLVADRWYHLVGGDYVTPPCPSETRLRELLETANLAACMPDEGRYPQFNLVATPANDQSQLERIQSRWPFVKPRALSENELRRLAPAVDLKKSAVWVEWMKTKWRIAGLADLGTSWHRARMGLEYRYHHPTCLMVQVEGPNRMRVYQGGYRVAMLMHGRIEGADGIEVHLSLHDPVNSALPTLRNSLTLPKNEAPKEYFGFEFIALWNTFAAIANSISLEGHGGAVLIIPFGQELPSRFGKPKYPQKSSILRTAFIEFMNARNRLADVQLLREMEKPYVAEDLYAGELAMRDAYSNLVEATRFVAQLAGCDGAVVMSNDLILHGFGCEISAELKRNIAIVEKEHEWGDDAIRLDVEQFGMRHRSALKLISQMPEYRMLVISQDGAISSVWFEKGNVCIRKTSNLVNMNLPWA